LQGIGQPQDHGRLLCICRFISDADDQQAHESEDMRLLFASAASRRQPTAVARNGVRFVDAFSRMLMSALNKAHIHVYT
jgi:hypothetical protein